MPDNTKLRIDVKQVNPPPHKHSHRHWLWPAMNTIASGSWDLTRDGSSSNLNSTSTSTTTRGGFCPLGGSDRAVSLDIFHQGLQGSMLSVPSVPEGYLPEPASLALDGDAIMYNDPMGVIATQAIGMAPPQQVAMPAGFGNGQASALDFRFKADLDEAFAALNNGLLPPTQAMAQGNMQMLPPHMLSWLPGGMQQLPMNVSIPPSAFAAAQQLVNGTDNDGVFRGVSLTSTHDSGHMYSNPSGDEDTSEHEGDMDHSAGARRAGRGKKLDDLRKRRRESARQSRARKKVYVQSLERENRQLKELVDRLRSENKEIREGCNGKGEVPGGKSARKAA